MAIKQLSDGGSEGTVMGQSETDLIGFHGATPVVQPSGADQAAVAATAATSSTPFGYAENQANDIVTLLNEIRSVLVANGLMKGSA